MKLKQIYHIFVVFFEFLAILSYQVLFSSYFIDTGVHLVLRIMEREGLSYPVGGIGLTQGTVLLDHSPCGVALAILLLSVCTLVLRLHLLYITRGATLISLDSYAMDRSIGMLSAQVPRRSRISAVKSSSRQCP